MADSASGPPPDRARPQGLYDPAQEHDACGVAFVVDIAGRRPTTSSSRA